LEELKNGAGVFVMLGTLGVRRGEAMSVPDPFFFQVDSDS